MEQKQGEEKISNSSLNQQISPTDFRVGFIHFYFFFFLVAYRIEPINNQAWSQKYTLEIKKVQYIYINP